ncbi:hypothetical protein VTJ04DRAFT_1185 [Mycothermus thermophilus]|uniref:uncharacterized protein n=1 Tax=Humicola insolens TaxID=85995 RepID=UPI0037432752
MGPNISLLPLRSGLYTGGPVGYVDDGGCERTKRRDDVERPGWCWGDRASKASVIPKSDQVVATLQSETLPAKRGDPHGHGHGTLRGRYSFNEIPTFPRRSPTSIHANQYHHHTTITKEEEPAEQRGVGAMLLISKGQVSFCDLKPGGLVNIFFSSFLLPRSL